MLKTCYVKIVIIIKKRFRQPRLAGTKPGRLIQIQALKMFPTTPFQIL